MKGSFNRGSESEIIVKLWFFIILLFKYQILYMYFMLVWYVVEDNLILPFSIDPMQPEYSLD